MIRRTVQHTVLTSLAMAAITLTTAIPALARPGVLTSNDPGTRINVRSQPTTAASSPHYGFAGDRVEIIRETMSSDGYTWYYVEFLNSGARGWIRGDFVRASGSGDRPNPPTRWSHIYYCGDYTITLRELANDNYSYSSRSRYGNLDLSNGFRSNTGRAWQYTFYNGDTVYEIMDTWANGSIPGNAVLNVSQGNRRILRQGCAK